jgi:hypothetical protein
MKTNQIGVILSDDSAQLFRVRFVGKGEDFVKVETLNKQNPRWIRPSDFWVLLDEIIGSPLNI